MVKIVESRDTQIGRLHKFVQDMRDTVSPIDQVPIAIAIIQHQDSAVMYYDIKELIDKIIDSPADMEGTLHDEGYPHKFKTNQQIRAEIVEEIAEENDNAIFGTYEQQVRRQYNAGVL